MLRFLINRCCLLIVMAGCSPMTAQTLQSKEVSNPYFLPSGEAKVYRSTLDYKESSWTGILAVRHYPEDKYDIIWMDEMGRTLMDAELNKDNWSYRYLLPQLDKWIIRRILKSDFRLLLKEKLEVRKSEQSGDTLIFRNGDKMFAYDEQKLIRIEDTRGWLSSAQIFFGENGAQIHIDHLRIDLSIELIQTDAASLSGSEQAE